MDPIDTVRRYAAAWMANDIATVLGMYHDDFVLHYYGQSPLAGDHVGRDAAIANVDGGDKRGRCRQLDTIEDVLGGDTFAAIIAREGVGEPTTVVRRLFLYTVREQQARRVLALRRGSASHRSPLEHTTRVRPDPRVCSARLHR